MVDRATAEYVVIGGILSGLFLLAPYLFGPVGPFFGGLIAGFLEGGDDVDRGIVGLGVGAVALATAVGFVLVVGQLPDASGWVAVLRFHARILASLLQVGSFLVLGLLVLPVAGAWTGGWIRSRVTDRERTR